jgi:cell division protein FtsA
MNTQPIIVGLDIGTTKIAAIAGRKNEFGKLEIVGFGKAASNGVKHGMVLNIDQVIKSIQLAMENCLKSNPDLEVSEVYVGIAGHHIKSLQTRGDLVRKNTDDTITQAEVEDLIADQRKTYIPAGDEIIEVIPQEYQIDNYGNITDPIGYNGVKFGANFHIITGDKNCIKNINSAVEKTGLKIKDLVLQPLASAAAVLNEQDLEAGVVIVDIGGGTTDLAIFCDGVLKHTAVIPFGGENITNDIKAGVQVLKTQAEQMKVQFGSALAEETKANAYITIPGLRGMPPKEVSVRNLSNIIEARMSEILDFVAYHIKQVGLDNKQISGGVILTGGGAQLKHLTELTELKTGMNARIGFPNEHLAKGYIPELSKPVYATCLGMILKGYFEYEKNMLKENPNYIKVTQPFSDEANQMLDENQAEVTFQNTNVGNEQQNEQENETPVKKEKKTKRRWLENFKSNLIELFKDEDEKEF